MLVEQSSLGITPHVCDSHLLTGATNLDADDDSFFLTACCLEPSITFCKGEKSEVGQL